jgi:hypothetical protein
MEVPQMSSKLIRRIAALVVAVLIPFGAAAPSAHAADLSPAPQTQVSTGDDGGAVGFSAYSLWRSSWS